MKTPRGILLARHQAAEPRLDTIRQAVINELNNADSKARSLNFVAWLLGCSNTLWRELILPSRRVWAGLAAAWFLLFVINVSQRDTVSSVTGQPVRSPAVMMSWQVQQRWMDELLADRLVPLNADRPKNITPRPRTENFSTCTV